MKIKILVMSLVLALTLSIGGCHKRVAVQNVPAGVNASEVASWYAATQTLDDFAKDVNTATKTVIALSDIKDASGKPLLDKAYYQSVLGIFGKVAQAGIHADNILKASPNHFSEPVQLQVQSDIALALGQLSAIETEKLFAVKDPAQTALFQQQVQGLVTSLVNVQKLVLAFKQ